VTILQHVVRTTTLSVEL